MSPPYVFQLGYPLLIDNVDGFDERVMNFPLRKLPALSYPSQDPLRSQETVEAVDHETRGKFSLAKPNRRSLQTSN